MNIQSPNSESHSLMENGAVKTSRIELAGGCLKYACILEIVNEYNY